MKKAPAKMKKAPIKMKKAPIKLNKGFDKLPKTVQAKILKKVRFTHPYFDQSALDFQSELKNLQNKRNIYWC